MVARIPVAVSIAATARAYAVPGSSVAAMAAHGISHVAYSRLKVGDAQSSSATQANAGPPATFPFHVRARWAMTAMPPTTIADSMKRSSDEIVPTLGAPCSRTG